MKALWHFYGRPGARQLSPTQLLELTKSETVVIGSCRFAAFRLSIANSNSFDREKFLTSKDSGLVLPD